MKVKDLMELLARCDADAEVVVMEQPNYPMEHGLAGVATRGDCREPHERRYASDTAPNDVILVEGAWLRYGEKAAWDAVRRRR